jgi:hypothetical protein
MHYCCWPHSYGKNDKKRLHLQNGMSKAQILSIFSVHPSLKYYTNPKSVLGDEIQGQVHMTECDLSIRTASVSNSVLKIEGYLL